MAEEEIDHNKTPRIRVLIRKRPLNVKEISKGEKDIVTIENMQTVILHEPKVKVDLTPFIQQYKFNFDGAYNDTNTNQQIYQTAIRELVDCAFDGAKVSCFAYGQTGSGKTYTMLGNHHVKGLYLLAANDIFRIEANTSELDVWVSFYQIYCGKLYDLLNEKNILFAREDAKNNVNIVGLSQSRVKSTQNLMEIIDYGMGIRVTSQNGTNADSSRSHAILQISLKVKNKLHGKISFIDLAGSERAADHADQLQKQTRIDGAQINKSLLALKQCIRALDQNKNHTPFRGSKLTMVLKDSFTGYCRTVMIGNIAPNSLSCENTLNTLKYADRVKQLKKPSKQNFMQMQKIEQLSRELMLPRTVQLGRNKSQKAKSQNIKQDMEDARENINHNQPRFSQNNKARFLAPKSKPATANLQRRSPSIRNSSNVYHQISRQSYNIPKPHEHSPNTYKLPIQQSQPQQLSQGMNMVKLSQKHDQYVQRILESEQQLLREHELHINSQIELTKEEMFIRNEADKIGSNIEQYLDNLDALFDKKMQSIINIKNKIAKTRRYLFESKKIQDAYSKINTQLHPGLQYSSQQDLLFNN